MTITVAGEPLIAYLLASVRIVAWLAIVPPFSSRGVPAMAKVVLSLGLAFAVTPGMKGDIPVDFLNSRKNWGRDSPAVDAIASGLVLASPALSMCSTSLLMRASKSSSPCSPAK